METKRWRMGERGLKWKLHEERERERVEKLVIRRSATHTSSVCGVCKLTGWLFFLSWIRRQEKQRRIKSYYSTQGEADICRQGGEGEEDEHKGHSLTTEIYNGLHCKGELNTITKIHLSPPSLPGWLFYICAGKRERERDNQTCTFHPHYGYLHILIGCFVDDNYLLEYRIPKWASGWRNAKKGQKKKKKRAEVCKGANDIQSADCVSSAWWQRPIIMNHWLSATDK